MSILLAPCLVLLAACGDDDDDLKKIILPSGQNKELSFAANSCTGGIEFTATADWSAWTSSASGVPEELEWLTLHNTHGPAGDATVPFTVGRNRTGRERTAYVIVACEDHSISFKVTQKSEYDGDEPDADISGRIEVHKSRYVNGANGLEYDGDEVYALMYEAGRLVEMTLRYRDDMEDDDDYCETVETTHIEYDEVNGHARAMVHAEHTYYPSGNVEWEDSEHDLYYTSDTDGCPRALRGSYYWPQEDGYPAKFDFSYSADGYLVRSRNDDGVDGDWRTCGFAWTDGDLSVISSTYGTVSFEYTDRALLNSLACFDLNWALHSDFEVLDFAAGDISRVWAVAGFLGAPSKNLATAVTETDRYGVKRAARITYKTHTAEKTEVRVEQFTDNQQVGYTDWQISYYGTLK